MYHRKSRLSAKKQNDLITHFVAGTTARATGEIIGVNKNTATSYFMRLRKLIASKLPSYKLSGEVEMDESYFGGKRKGKRSLKSRLLGMVIEGIREILTLKKAILKNRTSYDDSGNSAIH